MTKRYDEPIEVTPDPAHSGAPVSFNWRGRRYEIDRWVDSWREAGRWWTKSKGNGDGVREREFFRVLARPRGALATGDLDADGFMRHVGAVYDLYRDRIRDEWRLARVWD